MEEEIIRAPPPWTLKGTVYLFSFWVPKSQAQNLPVDLAYSPLEGGSSYAARESSGHPVGGLSMIQIIRYAESPVGPYDELILAPGFHEYTVEGQDGKRETKRNSRVTRTYVSQKHTCWNGRKNWNIPKHLATFSFTENKDGSTTVKVFPHDTTGDLTEASASAAPLFQANIKPVQLMPSFPMSLGIFKYLGIDVTLVQPPLPEGQGSQGELPGTEQWCAIAPAQYSPRTSLIWFDINQKGAEGDPANAGARGSIGDNFWPGLGRWQVGLKMENTVIDFPEGRHWDPPRSLL